MKSMRKVFDFVLVLMLAGFAMPSIAADKLMLLSAKTYALVGTSVTAIGNVIPKGTTTVVLLDYANQSPNGANSVMKSINAYIPTDVKFAYAASKSVNVSNSNPSVSCPAPLASYFPASAPTTAGSGGEAATTTVSYQQNSITGVKPQGHFCLYLAVTTDGTVSCSASNWKGEANTGNSFSGGVNFYDFNDQTQPYSMTKTTDGCTGILGCNTTNNTAGGLDAAADIAYIGQPDWGLVRSQVNKDLTACTAAVPFQFNFDPSVADNQTAEFVIPPNNLNQAVAVEYVLLWTPVPVDAADTTTTAAGWTTTPSGRPQMAWVKDNSGNYVYVDALRCVIDDITIGYAALPKIPNTAYWQQFIGQYNDEYSPNAQAKMCISQQGSTSVGRSDPNDSSSAILIQYWHKVLDYGDGAIRIQ